VLTIIAALGSHAKMTKLVAEHEQNLLDNNPTPFQRFFMHVLAQNEVVSGAWIPPLAIMVMWMNARAVDYGAVVWPVSKEGDGHLEDGWGDVKNVVSALMEMADVIDSVNGVYVSKEEVEDYNNRLRYGGTDIHGSEQQDADNSSKSSQRSHLFTLNSRVLPSRKVMKPDFQPSSLRSSYTTS